MTEQATSEQQTQQETGQSQQQAQQRQDSRQEQQSQQEQAMVPSSRLREETGRRQEAEKKLAEYEAQQQQQEEKQAKEQGEWEQVAEKRQEKIQKLEGELERVKAQQTRDARYRMFSRAASGVLLPEAIDDAFTFLTEDDLKDTNLEDENSWAALAQRLAERKPYLADGARGTGSGGSGRPVLGQGDNKRGRSAISDMKSKQNKRAFK